MVEENTQAEKPKEDVEEKPLDKMTAPELREIAVEIPDVSGVHAMKKEELLMAIKEHRGIQDEEPKKRKKKTSKVKLSPKELKAKIVQLRQEKENARAADDKKKVDVLRLRINRMKKKTRQATKG